jgi:hypothetical protein
MNTRVINLSPDEIMQLKRGENIRIQFKDTMLILAGTKREKKLCQKKKKKD